MLAFLDANAVAEGVTLVVPTAHRERLRGLSSAETAAVFDGVRRVTGAIESAIEPDGSTQFQANGAAADQEVFHTHVHVVPRYADGSVTVGIDPGDLEPAAAERVPAAIRVAR